MITTTNTLITNVQGQEIYVLNFFLDADLDGAITVELEEPVIDGGGVVLDEDGFIVSTWTLYHIKHASLNERGNLIVVGDEVDELNDNRKSWTPIEF